MANERTYAGIHGGGAAYAALRLFGAVMDCGVGLRGTFREEVIDNLKAAIENYGK